MSHSAKLGQNIRSARLAMQPHLTQLALAHKIGMSGPDAGSYICHVEKGKTTPRIDTLAKLAKVLKTDVHQLIPRMG